MVTKVAIGQCRVSKGSREEIENSLRSHILYHTPKTVSAVTV